MEFGNKIAEQLLQIKAIKLNAKIPFTWASGIKSPIYCDNRIALSFPHVRTSIKKALIHETSSFDAFDVIAGVATAGIPHAAILADAMGLPFIYVRGKAKSHGRKNLIEGFLCENQRVLVIEDLISTGGSSMEAIKALKEAGARVTGLLAIFTYELDFSKRRFEEKKTPVRTLTNYSTLINIAKKLSYIDEEDVELLAAWRKSPGTWKPTINKTE